MFDKYFPLFLNELIADQTNLYARHANLRTGQLDHMWQPCTANDVMKYLKCLVFILCQAATSTDHQIKNTVFLLWQML